MVILEGGQKTRMQAGMPRVKTVFIEFLIGRTVLEICDKEFPQLLFMSQGKAEMRGHQRQIWWRKFQSSPRRL